RYDVLLCDLRMPNLDVPAFYATLARQEPALCQRVIFLTGDVYHAASMAFLAQCGQPWLAKPCTVAAVRSALQQVLGVAAPATQRGQARRAPIQQSQQLR